VGKQLRPNTTEAEISQAQGVTAFNSDGFSLGTDDSSNKTSSEYVAWQWKANGGSRTTNAEDGHNPGGGYQANTTAGFSIVDYTGVYTSAPGTMAHGLGAVPHMIVVRNREIVGNPIIYHHKNTAAPETDILDWSSNAATYDNVAYWNDTAPTSSVFTINTSNDVNKDDDGIIAYCWTSIQGYSKFGSYNGNTVNGDGTFVYTGFSPAFIMVKNTERTQNWSMHTNKIPGYNGDNKRLQANLSDAEATNNPVDLLSNGFKWRSNDGDTNGYTHIHVYMAFAEQPFVTSTGIPATAR
jgi:hypothetical protein